MSRTFIKRAKVAILIVSNTFCKKTVETSQLLVNIEIIEN